MRCAATCSVLLVCSAAFSAWGQSAAEWDAFTQRFIEADFRANPHIAVWQGRHEFDGVLPDWSREGISKEISRLKAERAALDGLDVSALDPRRQFERQVLLAHCDGGLFFLEDVRWPFRNPKYYFDWLDPDVYLSREYAPLPKRMEALTRFLTNLPAALRQIQANLETPLPRTYIEYARMQAGGSAEFYESDAREIFETVKDESPRADYDNATTRAVRALQDFDSWLEGELPRATEGFAIGAENFSKMLWTTERVDIPLDRLKALGEADLERNLKAFREACEAYAPGKSIDEAVELYSANKPPDGTVAGATRQLDDLKRFILDHDIVSIPGPEKALVKESPPYARWNFAYINIPGPFEQNLPSIYYISPPDPSWSPADQANYLPSEETLLNTSVHEVWPGHFLHYLFANRAESLIGRVYTGYAFSEGWAHYAEEMMVDRGLETGAPAMRIAQLRDALLRDVRFLSAIGLHTEGMTVAESEAMFRERGFQDPGTSRQQAARGTFDPQYLYYTLGKLTIRDVRDEWCASRGGRAAWHDYHDQLLSLGAPPIGLIRGAMMDAER